MITKNKAPQKQGYKFCPKCQSSLPQNDFYATGGYCKPCFSSYSQTRHRTLIGHALQAYWDQPNPEYTKQEFINWIVNQTNYPKLFSNWSASKFLRKFTPTVYRTDAREPFHFGNLNIAPWHIAKRHLRVPGGAA